MRARKIALQALYQWHISQSEIYDIEAQFHVANDMNKIDAAYFHRLLQGVVNEITALDEAIAPLLDRPLLSLNHIELAALRLGTFELLFCPEIPYRVVIDEAVSLTKAFGAHDGYRYVNGVLNNLAKQVRTDEP